ncbi:pantoate--beta-alanine ligase [Streptomyces bohaiensis]|uniref:pantoate--beta-alanine ligase n=1 Tax=Streptomyces bohaiensis TaxID=1431344 RepID=UPI0030C75442
MTGPQLVHTAADLAGLRRPGATRAVVMTMGALHRGHAALVAAARREAGPDGQVVVTVFVNPLQFGPGEDFDRYPRTLPDDLRIAGEAGADVVFAPAGDEVYPDGTPLVTLAAGPMGERLEGAHRPGHFDGVLTVVAKLLHLTDPDVALFGEKDAQQLALIRRMVRDLDFPVRTVGVPTVREEDGLALSSRNRYLSPTERRTALALSRALFAARDRLAAEAALRARVRQAPPAGPGRAEALAALDQEEASADARAVAHAAGPADPAGSALVAADTVLREAARLEPPLETDYLALVDPATFTEIAPGDPAPPGPAVLAVAARVGATRLIDNIHLDLGTAP